MSTEFIKTIKNDVYGNERNVIHFFHILRDVECEAILLANKSANVGKSIADDDYKCYLDDAYEYAIEKTKKIGGKKFHNKSFWRWHCVYLSQTQIDRKFKRDTLRSKNYVMLHFR